MSLLFLWVPKNKNNTSRGQFEVVLSKQIQLLKDGFLRDFSLNIKEVNGLLIGQIHYDAQIQGWKPWIESNTCGIAWSGICEQFLGKSFEEDTLKKTISTVSKNPEKLIDWDGRFGVCTWNVEDDAIYLTTGATETTSFWYTEGPDGWALGNRALPLLELTGKEKAIDLEMATIYAAFGYQMGMANLFKGVVRLSSRKQVKIKHNKPPAIKNYLPLEIYFSNERELSYNDAVDQFSDRIVTRIKNQLAYSSNPLVLLTGGRDSRCIAAAAVSLGYKGDVKTSGSADYEDVINAKIVAKKLGLNHINSISKEFHEEYLKAPNRIKLWMMINEGLEQPFSLPEDFCSGKALPEEMEQKFHGLGGEIGRGFYYPQNEDLNGKANASQVFDVLTKKMPTSLKYLPQAKERLFEIVKDIEIEINQMELSLAQWLDLFYWQNRCLHWGEDMMAAKHMMGWHWTPLLDQQLIKTTWNIDPKIKVNNKFIEDVTIHLQPTLKGIAYNNPVKHQPKNTHLTSRRIFNRISNYVPGLKNLFNTKDKTKNHEVSNKAKFLNEIFMNEGSHLWPKIIDKLELKEALKNPNSKLIRNLGNLEVLENATTKSSMAHLYSLTD